MHPRLGGLLAALFLVTSASAQVLRVPAIVPDPPLPPGWTIEAKQVGWKDQQLFVRAFTTGNCRMEEQEECFPAPGGGTVCRVVTKEVCDDDIHYFAFGPEATVHDQQWLYLLREGADPVIFGKAFKTFPYRNVVLWHGAKLVWTEEFRGLELDLEKLGQSLREALFGVLYLD